MDSNACGLAAASISSTGSPENNLLDTGTLGWNSIDNHAEYDVEHQSVGMSSGGSIGDQFAGNMANGLLVGGNSSGSASSTTNSAVSGGTITVRDQDTLAAGLVGGVVGDSTAGAQAGKNAAENNALGDIAERQAFGITPEDT